MKKIIAILVVSFFLGGITAPVFAANNAELLTISLQDDDPKKTKKSEKKSADCDVPAEKKSADCDAKAAKDCEKKCDGSK